MGKNTLQVFFFIIEYTGSLKEIRKRNNNEKRKSTKH